MPTTCPTPTASRSLPTEQAVDAARARMAELSPRRCWHPHAGPYTVADAIADYVDFTTIRRKSGRDVEVEIRRAHPAGAWQDRGHRADHED